MSDMISRQAAIDAVQHAFDKETILNSFVRKVAIDALKVMPSSHPDLSSYSDKLWRNAYERGRAEAQAEIIRCKDCKWWGYDDDTGAGRICHAAKHGHISSHWDIHIFRRYRGDFYCADAERRTDESLHSK